MKRSLLTAVLGWVVFASHAHAQYTVRMPDPMDTLSRQERQLLRNQAAGFYDASRSSVATAARSSVSIYDSVNRLCYGTAVVTGRTQQPAVLTKWSEISHARNRLVIVTAGGKALSAWVQGVYPEHDLALLRYDAKATGPMPLDLSRPASLALGSFVLMARPDGNVESMGVVSVEPRSLRESDKAYLGVMMDFSNKGKEGVPLQKIMPGSAAANAGLREGDIIIALNREGLTGWMEMKTMLQRLQPGSKIQVTYKRGNVRKNTTVELGSMAEDSTIPNIPQERMEIMEQMGTTPSGMRADFPNVAQSDMPISPSDAGAPVTNLDGEIAGIAIARGSRIKTYIIPTATIRDLLAAKPMTVAQVDARHTGQHDIGPGKHREDPIERVLRLLQKNRQRR